MFSLRPADKSECQIKNRVTLLFKDGTGFVGEGVEPLTETDVVIRRFQDNILLLCRWFCKSRILPQMLFLGRSIGFFSCRIKFHSLLTDDQRVINGGGKFPADLNAAGIGWFIVEEIVTQREVN